ncbi:28 kDa ribonucleoprotein, chloroplastic [Apostasia shenzhenica]|uniref:28 kDa ribonucleoprotein, chloroplastic n=1 Tax=Apostasia shenzhenica TaxID=1088818 RepID=A0A2I0ALC3_9ASPA|nr:28 kDa ribonucleoprotein, chloroplastic [Apostasia shenzhenica]
MVLSHKKLKQKLRSLLAESLAATGSKKSRKDLIAPQVDHELQIVRQLLGAKSRKHRPPKRGKSGTEIPSSEDSKQEDGNGGGLKEKCEIRGVGEICGSVGLKKNDENKKRNRAEVGDERLEESFPKKKMKKAERKKEKQKKKRRERRLQTKGRDTVDEQEAKKNEDASKSVNGESKLSEAVESVQTAESEPKKVYVGGIPYYSNEDDIRSFFENCGTVLGVDCMRFPESEKFRGIAILTFKTEAAAKRALALDGADMGGFYLKIQPYRSTRNPRPEKPDFAPEIVDGYNRIYVGNLAWDVSEDDLQHLFSDCKVSAIRFGTDKETGDFKGYAHVDFANSISLATALQLDHNIVCGRPVRIRCAVPLKKGVTASAKNGDSNSEPKAESKKKKNKRRTCYECGVPGHLSGECPRKRAVGSEDAEK